MTDSARELFEAHATGYDDAVRRQLVPPFDAFYGIAVASLAHAGAPLRRVLDLGAGTGLLSARIAAAHPGVALDLLDGSPTMLDGARERLDGGSRPALGLQDDQKAGRFGEGAGGVAFHLGDLRGAWPEGPFDAVVSALAIHHLEAPEKRELFRRAHDALRPGGLFVNAEQVLGATPELQRRYRAWHRAESARLGVTPEQWAASEERMAIDIWETVDDQLAWLEQAGFADADAPFRDHCFAVIVARRPPA